MATTRVLPEIAFVRVLSAGGPYAIGNTLSVAFVTPDVGRLALHGGTLPGDSSGTNDLRIPETISVCVLRSAGPYPLGTSLTLSFFDPGVARIHLVDHPSRETHRTTPDVAATPAHSHTQRENYAAFASEDGPDPEWAAAVAVPPPSRVHAAGDSETTTSACESVIDSSGETAPQRSMDDAPLAIERAIVADSISTATNPLSQTPNPDTLFLAQPHPPASRDRVLFAVPPAVDGFETTGSGQSASGNSSGAHHAGMRLDPTDHTVTRNLLEGGVRLHLDWNRERVRRFVQVVDKLFTIDRLGWYRHVFAMRLLVPDVVECGDAESAVEALRHLHALRAASVEVLGRPLLAAFMPNFGVTTDWLASLERPSASRALAGLRDALLPHVDGSSVSPSDLKPGWTVGAIGPELLTATDASSVEALLPVFIPYASTIPELSEKLSAYRATLLSIFGHVTQSAAAVRLNQMTQPNHTMDDRLWQLVGAVSEAFGGREVA